MFYLDRSKVFKMKEKISLRPRKGVRKMKRYRAIFLLMIGFFLCGIVSAHATVIYNSESDFLTAIGSDLYYLEEFDTFTYGNPAGVGTYPPDGARDFGPVNGFSYRMSAGSGENEGLWGLDGAVSVISPGLAILIEFTSANVTAVGGNFWVTNFNGDSIIGDITLALSDGTIYTSSVGADSFTGFITEGAYFTSMTIQAQGVTDTYPAGEYPTIDHLYVGASPSAVPIPSTLLLLSTGLVYLAGRRTKLK